MRMVLKFYEGKNMEKDEANTKDVLDEVDKVGKKIDRLESSVEILTNMMTSLLEDFSSRSNQARRAAGAARKQMEMAKKMALSNPMVKKNPGAAALIDSMFSASDLGGGDK